MNKHFQKVILQKTGASDLFLIEVIQSLWGDYGKIVRYGLTGAKVKSVVVKHVLLPKLKKQSRKRSADFSHNRKIRSYKIEMAWYKHFSQLCDTSCRVPNCLALDSDGDEFLMVLEDLKDSGFPDRKNSIDWNRITSCLKWLANFHATFITERPANLWPTGTYWHLGTRPHELKALKDKTLKKAALLIDKKLRKSPFQSFVHGDAKLENFCFSKNGKDVAAVDFQYVGGGCGIKDVAYFVSSCLYENDCDRFEKRLLDCYFKNLKKAIMGKQKKVDPDALEKNWRSLYHVAWTDFHRFYKGWSPEYNWKSTSYSERIAKKVIAEIYTDPAHSR